MNESDLKYVVAILKEEKPDAEPDWYAVLGFLSCHRIEGLFYNRAQNIGIELPRKIERILKQTYEKQKYPHFLPSTLHWLPYPY